MGFFDIFGGKRKDINEYVAQARETPNALIIDVRSSREYATSHIAGAINIPLDQIKRVSKKAKPDTPIYLYCLSGTRSANARKSLEAMGFTNVVNMGAIGRYRGEIAHGM